MKTTQDVVFDLWCRLTWQQPGELDDEQRSAFFAAPELRELSRLPYPDLLDAAITAASRGSLPLGRWLADSPSSYA